MITYKSNDFFKKKLLTFLKLKVMINIIINFCFRIEKAYYKKK